MVTVQDKMDEIKNGANYISGSLIIHSLDDYGTVIKWLENISNVAERKKIFIELDPSELGTKLEDRTEVSSIEIEPAQG